MYISLKRVKYWIEWQFSPMFDSVTTINSLNQLNFVGFLCFNLLFIFVLLVLQSWFILRHVIQNFYLKSTWFLLRPQFLEQRSIESPWGCMLMFELNSCPENKVFQYAGSHLAPYVIILFKMFKVETWLHQNILG